MITSSISSAEQVYTFSLKHGANHTCFNVRNLLDIQMWLQKPQRTLTLSHITTFSKYQLQEIWLTYARFQR